ncbi:MAG: alanine racemase [Eubacterium sp.]|nr:alanine racemase [Eubacterium sp.]
MKEKGYAGLDYFRLIAALLIVSIHTFPLISVSQEADFIFTHIIARVAVPFFLMVTGFFLIPELLKGKDGHKGFNALGGFLKKTSLLYGVAILIYLPVNIYTGTFKDKLSVTGIFKAVVFEGTFYHLWYLPASILGALIVSLLFTKFSHKLVLGLTLFLYLIALLGDSYYGLTEQVSYLKGFYDILFMLFDYTRNGLFMTPVFLALGGLIALSGKKYTIKTCLTGFAAATALLLTEGSILHTHQLQRHDSMYLMLLPCMFFLFHLLLNWRGKARNILRSFSMLIYIVHPMCIILVRGFAKAVHLTGLIIDNSIVHFITVTAASIVVSAFVLLVFYKKDKDVKKDRAWAEIDLNNLDCNINEFKTILPKSCNIMAVVKANAYGHGDIEIAGELNKTGINAFAVATIEEGIRLRKNGISGEILILGYTFPEQLYKLKQYDLTQTVVDLDYAEILNVANRRTKVHVKIDTGMHRLGENYNDIFNLYKIYECKNLIVTGTYTHLSVSDSLEQQDVDFTNLQIDMFYKTLENIREAGYNPGKIHLQSSYGVLNYPYLKCDFARIGIALYGVLSSENHKTRICVDLQPVLSIKARVVLTKEITKNESVGYGRQFTADRKTRIAVISIGYADGIPRTLSCGKGHVLIHGKKAAIIGKICMDQLMVDITDIAEVRQGDIATLIGRDGTESVSAEEAAAHSGTLTNEFLSRLGLRVTRNYINNACCTNKSRFAINLKNSLTSFKFSIKSSQLFSIIRE